MEIKRYIKSFWLMAKMVILPDLNQPSAAILFIIGKVARFTFYFLFLFSILCITLVAKKGLVSLIRS